MISSIHYETNGICVPYLSSKSGIEIRTGSSSEWNMREDARLVVSIARLRNDPSERSSASSHVIQQSSASFHVIRSSRFPQLVISSLPLLHCVCVSVLAVFHSFTSSSSFVFLYGVVLHQRAYRQTRQRQTQDNTRAGETKISSCTCA